MKRAPGAALLIAILVTGCQHSSIKKKIALLDSEISTERDSLAKVAEPYRATGGAGFQFDVTGQPVLDALQSLDNVSSTSRTIHVRSFDYDGYIAEKWTRCWPSKKKMGIYVSLARHDALQMLFHVGKTHPRWNESGLEFDFDVAGAGGALLLAGVKFCIGSMPIAPAFVTAVLPPLQRTKGRLRISPGNDGLEYQLVLDDPPRYFLGLSAGGFNAGWPIRLDRTLTGGTIPNLVGSKGSIQLAKAAKTRNFVLDVLFDKTALVVGGVQASGPIKVTWSDAVDTKDD